MKQIKFKAQRLSDNKWIYGYYLTNQEEPWNYGLYHGKHFIKSINNGIDFEVRPETVCEFTGLKDINGIDIYEGDILVIDKEKCLVFYSQNDCSFSLDYDGREYPLTQDLAIKVIGSIHD